MPSTKICGHPGPGHMQSSENLKDLKWFRNYILCSLCCQTSYDIGYQDSVEDSKLLVCSSSHQIG